MTVAVITKIRGVRANIYIINAVRFRIRKLEASYTMPQARLYVFLRQTRIFVYGVQTILCILRHD